MTVLFAFTVEHAARATNVSPRRIRYWDRTGVLVPSLATGSRRTPYGRIYSFRDLVGLRTLGQLRDRFGFSLQKLRIVGDWLREHFDSPWSELRFYVSGREIYFGDPESGQIVSADRRGQGVIPFYLDRIAEETERSAMRLLERRPEDIGRVVKNRYVMSNRPVLAGTRIPTAAVWEFHRAGLDVGAIIEKYPRLTEADVREAIAFEEARQGNKKAG